MRGAFNGILTAKGTTPLGLRPHFPPFSQGSSSLATLGFVTESLRDSDWRAEWIAARQRNWGKGMNRFFEGQAFVCGVNAKSGRVKRLTVPPSQDRNSFVPIPLPSSCLICVNERDL
jgi:hypothetical protein